MRAFMGGLQRQATASATRAGNDVPRESGASYQRRTGETVPIGAEGHRSKVRSWPAISVASSRPAGAVWGRGRPARDQLFSPAVIGSVAGVESRPVGGPTLT